MPKTVDVVELKLCGSQEIFIAGQTVAGHLNVNFSEALPLRCLRLQVDGKAYVHWTEKTSTGKGMCTLVSWGRNDYLKEDIILWGKRATITTVPENQSEKHPEGKHPAGKHTYSFQIRIPESGPGSFEGTYGYLRYTLRIILDYGLAKHDVIYKRVLSVIGQPIPRDHEELANEVEAKGSKSFGLLCWKSGPVALTLRIQKRGYVAGERISLEVEVHNSSSKTIDSVELRLLQTVTFTATSLRTSARNKVNTVAQKFLDESIAAGESACWKNQELLIPPVPPTFDCDVLQFAYSVTCDVVPLGMAFNLKVTIPITILSVPLKSDFGKFVGTSSEHCLGGAERRLLTEYFQEARKLVINR